MSAVERFRDALAVKESAEAEVIRLAAEYVDAHPELDITGEWKRMRGIFSQRHYLMWDGIEVDEDWVEFYKTTNMGAHKHTVTVPLDALG